MMRCASAILGFLLLVGRASASDPFHTGSAPGGETRSQVFGELAACAGGPVGSPLTLAEAVSRALCANVDARDAWAVVEQRAAGVGAGKSAYLPTVSASGQWLRENNTSNVRQHAELSSNYSSSVNSDNVSMEWLLYDFGGRRAALDHAKALLGAAQANEEAVLQQAFADAAKAYYAALAAQARVRADEDIVDNAAHSLAAARERVARGVAPVTEAYQAEVAQEKATVTLNRDRGQALAAKGTLAQGMGLPPSTELDLAGLDDADPDNHAFEQSVTDLMRRAEREHPAILAAEQSVAAARAGVTHAQAQGRPTVKLVAQYSRNNEPIQQGQGFPHYPATGHDGYIGVQLSVPLFTGFSTTYQVREAQGEVDQQAVALDKARRQVALQVWTSYQTLRSDADNLTASARLEAVANQAWESAQRRYRSGIGTILELITTQTDLAQARQERVEALASWRYDRFALGAALGRLGPSDLSR